MFHQFSFMAPYFIEYKKFKLPTCAISFVINQYKHQDLSPVVADFPLVCASLALIIILCVSCDSSFVQYGKEIKKNAKGLPVTGK